MVRHFTWLSVVRGIVRERCPTEKTASWLRLLHRRIATKRRLLSAKGKLNEQREVQVVFDFPFAGMTVPKVVFIITLALEGSIIAMLTFASQIRFWGRLCSHKFVVPAVIAFSSLLGTSSAFAQALPPAHYFAPHSPPPGMVGNWKLAKGAPYAGYFQPVEVTAPEGAVVSFAADGEFMELETAPLRVGLLIGQVYRLRVANIPLHEGQEVYPTIEMIDRTFPPCGQALQFPIPIDLAFEDIELALKGKFVTRVIYLEDPRMALPIAEKRNSGRWFDAGPTANPIQVADTLGRPLAILRIGGRVPGDQTEQDESFYGSGGPLLKFPKRPPQQIREVIPLAPPADAPPADAPPAVAPPADAPPAATARLPRLGFLVPSTK